MRGDAAAEPSEVAVAREGSCGRRCAAARLGSGRQADTSLCPRGCALSGGRTCRRRRRWAHGRVPRAFWDRNRVADRRTLDRRRGGRHRRGCSTTCGGVRRHPGGAVLRCAGGGDGWVGGRGPRGGGGGGGGRGGGGAGG